MARKPHGSSGSPQQIGALLGAFLRQSAQGRVVARDLVAEAWARVAGPEVAQATRVDGFQGGILRVEVESAALLQELATFRRDALLKALREDPCMGVHDIRGIRFRLC